MAGKGKSSVLRQSKANNVQPHGQAFKKLGASVNTLVPGNLAKSSNYNLRGNAGQGLASSRMGATRSGGSSRRGGSY